MNLLDFKGIESDKYRSFAFAVIGPISEIKHKEAQDGYEIFYDSLINERDINVAIRRLIEYSGLIKKFVSFTCDEIFEMMIDRFVREHLTEKDVKRLIRSSVSNYIRRFGRASGRSFTKKQKELTSGDFFNKTIEEWWMSYYWIDRWPENQKRFRKPKLELRHT